MPGNRRVTFDLPPRQYSPPALGDDHCPALLPSPESRADELTDQISTLRAELRDGRILQARQRSQLNHEAVRVAELTRKYKEVKQECQELNTKLGYEKDTAAAIQKRLNVAVKNHAEAQDKCARTMVECERLRILNEHFSAMNEELGVLRSEDEADFEEKIAQMGCAFRDQLEDAEAAFMRELEETQEKLKDERLKETKSLKKELDSRDAKIKRLEHDLNRQCEINAMFTLNYDRDTNFTKHLSMPLTIPVSETAGTSGLLKSTKFQLSSTRRPLIDLDTNNVTTRKRSRLPDRRGVKGDPTSSEADKSSSNNAATVKSPRDDDEVGSHKRAKFGHSSASAGRVSHSNAPSRTFARP